MSCLKVKAATRFTEHTHDIADQSEWLAAREARELKHVLALGLFIVLIWPTWSPDAPPRVAYWSVQVCEPRIEPELNAKVR